MRIKKLPLFTNNKERLLIFIVWLLSFAFSLGWRYIEYKDFISKPFLYEWGDVIQTFPHKKYKIIKIKLDSNNIIYTISYLKYDLINKRVRVEIFPKKDINFFEWLNGAFVKSKIKEINPLKASFKEYLKNKIEKQHNNFYNANFYTAIFLAEPVNKKLREKLSILGINHLTALSGFHIGVLWILIYYLLSLIYKPIQSRFFPWRFQLIDIGFLTIIILGFYIFFTGYPPSLIRAYEMLIILWLASIMGIEILSFEFLGIVIASLLIFFPSFIASIAFWLSIAGVFYIYLLLKYTSDYPNYLISLFIIPFGIFILMVPIVHSIFGTISKLQLLSPLLSLLFIPFYPVSILLHIIGEGGLFDNILDFLWNISNKTSPAEDTLPIFILVAYITLSLLAIRYKKAFYILIISAFIMAGYIYTIPIHL